MAVGSAADEMAGQAGVVLGFDVAPSPACLPAGGGECSQDGWLGIRERHSAELTVAKLLHGMSFIGFPGRTGGRGTVPLHAARAVEQDGAGVVEGHGNSLDWVIGEIGNWVIWKAGEFL